MVAKKRTVVIGFLGTQLDAGGGPGRWEKWRPTVAIAEHPDVMVDRMDLLHAAPHEKLAHLVASDIARVSPETVVQHHRLELRDPWDFEEVYGALFDWVTSYRFKPEEETYWAHIATGPQHALLRSHFVSVLRGRLPWVS